MIDTDLCVIGAGSGGLSVAAGAVQMGARVVLVERGAMGGDCLNHGCVPSKALIAAARAAQAVREAPRLGIATDAPRPDYAAVMDHVAQAIATIAPHDSRERFEALGCTVLQAEARFVSPREVVAGDTRIRARRFVIATGARPVVPDIPGLDSVPFLTNETLFALREAPRHLLILGAGPIGLEMAQAHRRLGVPVTVIDAGEALAGNPLGAELKAILRGEGVEILENRAVTAVRQEGEEIVLDAGAGLRRSHLLVAVGRKPVVEGLGLDLAGVATGPKGIEVDRHLRTANRRIYAIGDAVGGGFTHVAGYHAGQVVREVLFGLPAPLRDDHIPRVIYTDPELAQVGLTEAEARARWPDVEVAEAGIAANDRAVTQGETRGRIRVLVRRGRPVGVQILGPEAGELIAPWCLALSKRLKLSDISGMILPYPTLSEVGKRAAGAYFSPRLFNSPWVARVVRVIQRLVP